MDDESHVDDDETIFSPHTNRPITTTVVTTPPIFWCETCHLKLTSPTGAIQHLNGRPHKAKINAEKDPTIQNDCDISRLKHAFDVISNIKPAGAVVLDSATKTNKGQPGKTVTSVLQDLTNKKNKEQPLKTGASDPNLTCDDCNLVFDSPIITIQHFKGKKHAAKMAAKVAAKQNERKRGGQRGVRGGRGRGRGWGDVFGRGRGIIGPVNNFYGRTLSDIINPARDDYCINPSGNMQHNEPQNNYAVMQHNGFYGNTPSDYRTSQHQDYVEHFASSNGESLRDAFIGTMEMLPPKEYYYDYDSPSSTSNTSQSRIAAKKNQNHRGGHRGGRWQAGRGRGLWRGWNNKDGKFNRGGFGGGQSFQGYQGRGRGTGRGVGGGQYGGGPNPLSSSWWCKYFVKGTSMKGNS